MCVLAVSIVTFCLIIILVLSEIEYYTSTELQFDYEVDTNFSRYTMVPMITPVIMSTGIMVYHTSSHANRYHTW